MRVLTATALLLSLAACAEAEGPPPDLATTDAPVPGDGVVDTSTEEEEPDDESEQDVEDEPEDEPEQEPECGDAEAGHAEVWLCVEGIT